jgi:PPOX class probable F420-dependent enzyme
VRPPIRALTPTEVGALLALDIPAHLATIDADGFPRITPLWFLWDEGAFYMTSVKGQPHLRNIERDPRVALCVDVEEREVVDGHRPNRRIRAQGEAELAPDDGGTWTRRITLKYVRGEEGERAAERRAPMARVVIRLLPVRLLAQG